MPLFVMMYLGLCRFILDLLADGGSPRPPHAGRRSDLAPDLLHQLLTGENPSRSSGQEAQNIKFPRGKLERMTVL